MGFIYIIQCNKTNKAYVGQTTKTLDERFKEHLRAARNGHNVHLCRAIRKHGEDVFQIQLIEECSNALLNEREEYWIRALNTKVDGYNETWGGEGVKGYVHNEERRRLMKENHWRKRPDATEIAARIKDARKDWKPSPEAIAKTAAANRGKKRSERTRLLQSEKAQGSNNPMHGKPAPNRRPVEQLTMDGEHVAFYDSIRAAILALGVRSAAIAMCCEGKCKSSHGYRWRYV